jgi:hypothetical protein
MRPVSLRLDEHFCCSHGEHQSDTRRILGQTRPIGLPTPGSFAPSAHRSVSLDEQGPPVFWGPFSQNRTWGVPLPITDTVIIRDV